jgi:hypothetical protein
VASSVLGRAKRARQVKSKVKTVLKIFFDITANSSWLTKQSILHVTVTFYGDCVKMCEGFAPNFDGKRTGCCITTTHRSHTFFFTREFFTKNKMTGVPHPLFSGSPIEDKTDTAEVLEAESQAVLKTLTEHDFQDNLKNGRSSGKGTYTRKRTTSAVMVACSSSMSFHWYG